MSESALESIATSGGAAAAIALACVLICSSASEHQRDRHQHYAMRGHICPMSMSWRKRQVSRRRCAAQASFAQGAIWQFWQRLLQRAFFTLRDLLAQRISHLSSSFVPISYLRLFFCG